jgi:lipopolysaccharide transport system ATP-binding protein
MRKLEQEIIAFVDIGEFINYPIKTYSAGMLVRLAFAISTAIPGDLLLLDEVVEQVMLVSLLRLIGVFKS